MSDNTEMIKQCAIFLDLVVPLFGLIVFIELDCIRTELLKLAERPTLHGKEERR